MLDQSVAPPPTGTAFDTVARAQHTRTTPRVAAVLFAVLAALALFAHHELSDASFQPSANAMPAMSVSTGSPDNPADLYAAASVALHGMSPSSDSGHGANTPSCPQAGQMCASAAVSGHFVPAVPAGFDMPLDWPETFSHRVVESAIGTPDPPDLPTVLRI